MRAGAERAIVRARVQAGLDDPRSLLLEIEIIPGRANKASLNRGPLRRPRDLLGALRVVLFSPGGSGDRQGRPGRAAPVPRRALVTARWPRLAGVRADYDRVLKQRSTLLKSLSGRTARVAERGRRDHPRRLGRPAGRTRRRTGRGPAGHPGASCAAPAGRGLRRHRAHQQRRRHRLQVSLAVGRADRGRRDRRAVEPELAAPLAERHARASRRGDRPRPVPGRAAPRRPHAHSGRLAHQGVRLARRVVVDARWRCGWPRSRCCGPTGSSRC